MMNLLVLSISCYYIFCVLVPRENSVEGHPEPFINSKNLTNFTIKGVYPTPKIKAQTLNQPEPSQNQSSSKSEQTLRPLNDQHEAKVASTTDKPSFNGSKEGKTLTTKVVYTMLSNALTVIQTRSSNGQRPTTRSQSRKIYEYYISANATSPASVKTNRVETTTPQSNTESRRSTSKRLNQRNNLQRLTTEPISNQSRFSHRHRPISQSLLDKIYRYYHPTGNVTKSSIKSASISNKKDKKLTTTTSQITKRRRSTKKSLSKRQLLVEGKNSSNFITKQIPNRSRSPNGKRSTSNSGSSYNVKAGVIPIKANNKINTPLVTKSHRPTRKSSPVPGNRKDLSNSTTASIPNKSRSSNRQTSTTRKMYTGNARSRSNVKTDLIPIKLNDQFKTTTPLVTKSRRTTQKSITNTNGTRSSSGNKKDLSNSTTERIPNKSRSSNRQRSTTSKMSTPYHPTRNVSRRYGVITDIISIKLNNQLKTTTPLETKSRRTTQKILTQTNSTRSSPGKKNDLSNSTTEQIPYQSKSTNRQRSTTRKVYTSYSSTRNVKKRYGVVTDLILIKMNNQFETTTPLVTESRRTTQKFLTQTNGTRSSPGNKNGLSNSTTEQIPYQSKSTNRQRSTTRKVYTSYNSTRNVKKRYGVVTDLILIKLNNQLEATTTPLVTESRRTTQKFLTQTNGTRSSPGNKTDLSNFTTERIPYQSKSTNRQRSTTRKVYTRYNSTRNVKRRYGVVTELILIKLLNLFKTTTPLATENRRTTQKFLTHTNGTRSSPGNKNDLSKSTTERIPYQSKSTNRQRSTTRKVYTRYNSTRNVKRRYGVVTDLILIKLNDQFETTTPLVTESRRSTQKFLTYTNGTQSSPGNKTDLSNSTTERIQNQSRSSNRQGPTTNKMSTHYPPTRNVRRRYGVVPDFIPIKMNNQLETTTPLVTESRRTTPKFLIDRPGTRPLAGNRTDLFSSTIPSPSRLTNKQRSTTRKMYTHYHPTGNAGNRSTVKTYLIPVKPDTQLKTTTLLVTKSRTSTQNSFTHTGGRRSSAANRKDLSDSTTERVPNQPKLSKSQKSTPKFVVQTNGGRPLKPLTGNGKNPTNSATDGIPNQSRSSNGKSLTTKSRYGKNSSSGIKIIHIYLKSDHQPKIVEVTISQTSRNKSASQRNNGLHVTGNRKHSASLATEKIRKQSKSATGKRSIIESDSPGYVRSSSQVKTVQIKHNQSEATASQSTSTPLLQRSERLQLTEKENSPRSVANTQIPNQSTSSKLQKSSSESGRGKTYSSPPTENVRSSSIQTDQTRTNPDNRPKTTLPLAIKGQKSTSRSVTERNSEQNLIGFSFENEQPTTKPNNNRKPRAIAQSKFPNGRIMVNQSSLDDKAARRWIDLDNIVQDEEAWIFEAVKTSSVASSSIAYHSTTIEDVLMESTPGTELISANPPMFTFLESNSSAAEPSKETQPTHTTESGILIDNKLIMELKATMTVDNTVTFKPLSVKEKEREEEHKHESLFSRILRFIDKKASYQYYGFTASIRLEGHTVATGCIINEETVLTVLGTTFEVNEESVITQTLNAMALSVRTGQQQESEIEEVAKIFPFLHSPAGEIKGSLVVLLKMKNLFDFGKTIYAANINRTKEKPKQLVVVEWQRVRHGNEMDIPVSLIHYSVVHSKKCVNLFGKHTASNIICITRPATNATDYCGRLGSLLVERKTDNVLGILTHPSCDRTAGFTRISKFGDWIHKKMAPN